MSKEIDSPALDPSLEKSVAFRMAFCDAEQSADNGDSWTKTIELSIAGYQHYADYLHGKKECRSPVFKAVRLAAD
jgi:hypothetical protein